MADEDIRRLVQSIDDYAKWVRADEDNTPKATAYTQTLMDFLVFAINNKIAWEQMFSIETLEAFGNHSRFKSAACALVAFSEYLFSRNKIDQPLEISRPRFSSRWFNCRNFMNSICCFTNKPRGFSIIP